MPGGLLLSKIQRCGTRVTERLSNFLNIMELLSGRPKFEAKNTDLHSR